MSTTIEAVIKEWLDNGYDDTDDSGYQASVLAGRLAKVVAETQATMLREFVEWLSHQRAYNGAPHAGQDFHDYGLNMLLPQWAEEFIAGEDMPPSRDCIATTTCTRYGECRALTPCKTTRDVEDKPYRSQWGREDGLD